MRPARPAAIGAAFLLAAALGGCGPAADGLAREPVSGTVTLDGRPLDSGSITLVPTGDGPAVGGLISGGSFAIDRAGGPSPGEYRVEILSIRATGRTIPNPEGPKGTLVEEKKSVVPDRYGLRSTLTAVVRPGGPNVLDFPLDSTPDRTKAARRR